MGQSKDTDKEREEKNRVNKQNEAAQNAAATSPAPAPQGDSKGKKDDDKDKDKKDKEASMGAKFLDAFTPDEHDKSNDPWVQQAIDMQRAVSEPAKFGDKFLEKAWKDALGSGEKKPETQIAMSPLPDGAQKINPTDKVANSPSLSSGSDPAQAQAQAQAPAPAPAADPKP